MKKSKFSGKLSLNKETITKLNDSQLSRINGGALPSGGCTDGCGWFKTYWNCTKANCTVNCGD